MVLDVLLPSLAVVTLIVASYTDLKHREVPDWLNYGLIFAALGLRTLFSLELGWPVLLSGILGFVVCFLLACLFYYTNQWGGGDSKLLMAMGAIIGIRYPFDASSFQLLWFFAALLFLGAIYGILWMGYLAITQRKKFVPVMVRIIKRHNKVHISLMLLSGAFLLLSFFHSLFWPLTFFPLALFYLLTLVNGVEESCFVRKIDPLSVTEGDWLAEDVVVNAKRVVPKKTLEMREIRLLQSLKAQGKLKYILIKEGIPFVPSFLLAYLVNLFGKGFFTSFFSFLL